MAGQAAECKGLLGLPAPHAMPPLRVAVLPALNASATVAGLVRALRDGFDEVWVIDDGSTDDTAEVARQVGALVVSHAANLGKGAALRTALLLAKQRGVETIVTVDADGQHLAEDALTLAAAPEPHALILGVRDMARDGAPPANLRGNRIANYWIERLTRRRFRDSQCGLRRYPVAATHALGARGDRFAFESEVIVRAVHAGIPIVEMPVGVRYPPARTSHFRLWLDPLQMTFSLIRAAGDIGIVVDTFRDFDFEEAHAVHFGTTGEKAELPPESAKFFFLLPRQAPLLLQQCVVALGNAVVFGERPEDAQGSFGVVAGAVSGRHRDPEACGHIAERAALLGAL